MSGPRRHVVVVGGGITGLVSAVRLSDAGMQATVLEAQDDVGGQIRSVTLGEGRTCRIVAPDHRTFFVQGRYEWTRRWTSTRGRKR